MYNRFLNMLLNYLRHHCRPGHFSTRKAAITTYLGNNSIDIREIVFWKQLLLMFISVVNVPQLMLIWVKMAAIKKELSPPRIKKTPCIAKKKTHTRTYLWYSVRCTLNLIHAIIPVRLCLWESSSKYLGFFETADRSLRDIVISPVRL